MWSSVLDQAQSLAIIDEFGQFLGAASGGSDASTMKNGVLTGVMELYGRLDDIAITPQFSTVNLSARQREDAKRKMIERPALSIVGLTTPNEWYGALKSSRVSSGFLNRWLVLEVDSPRGDLADVAETDPPPSVIAWIRQLLAPHSDLDLPNRPLHIPSAKLLTILTPATQAFKAFKRECNALADTLENENLGELPMRAAEQAMRLALVAALAINPQATVIDEPESEWAIQVTRYQLERLVPSVRERMADSPIHALRNHFLSALRESGSKGLTGRELARHPVFRGVAKRERDDTVQWAIDAGYVGWGDIEQGPQGGRPRQALRVSAVMATTEAA